MVRVHGVCSFLISAPRMATSHSHPAFTLPLFQAAAFVPHRTRLAPQKLPSSWNATYSSKMVGVACASTMAATEINRVADFYDSSSTMWEDLWGDHMHHGFYDLGLDKGQTLPLSYHRAAQVRMIEEVLSFVGISEEEEKRPRTIVDVGCGIGGSARYLASKYGSRVKGITISPQQAERSTFLTSIAGLSDKVEFQVADAMNQPFPDGHFDLVWSLECAEHIPDKKKFLSELVRVVAPGGCIVIVTVCHRDLLPEEDSLKPEEQEFFDKISNSSVCLPAWCSRADYVKLAQSLHLEDIKTADWSEYVAPFGPAVTRTFSTWRAILGFLKSGWKAMKAMPGSLLVSKGHEEGLIKYTIISARKAT